MKIVCLTDIHFGNHSNSEVYNQQCLDFLQFVQEWTDLNMMEPFETVFLGDWYHNRSAINVKTLNYAKEGLVTLSNIGEKQYMLLGNHDLPFLDRRDMTSVIIPSEAEGIEIITEPIMIEDNLFCPWLIKDETLKDLIEEYNPKYVFGHFEIPSFHYNKKVVMQGDFNPFDYQGPRRILSGHFHMFSEKDNITYIGNCFSHDFSDSRDWNNKGFTILDTDTNTIERVVWDNAPKYLVLNISKLQDIKLPNNIHLRLINDIGLDTDGVNKLQEALQENKNIVELQILPTELNLDVEVDSVEMKDIGNMNVIIPEMLSNVEIQNINPKKLIDIYNNLEV